MSRIIGIDLGTTNSVVAVIDDGKPQIIPHTSGDRTMPSVVSFPKRQPVIGPVARNLQTTHPENTVYSIKRFMGRSYEEIGSQERIVPYELVGKSYQPVRVRIGRRRLTPQQISAMILGELKQIAETHLGEGVDKAVITVPAHFNDAQRHATIEAGELAGLEVVRIINEPTAAALAYGLEQHGKHRIIIFDFGGGTFDLSALELDDGAFEVLGVDGNAHLGGDDFDQRIIDLVSEDYRRREHIDPRERPLSLQRLKRAAEAAKRELSTDDRTRIALPYVFMDTHGPKHLEYTLSRERFETVCTDLFDNVRRSCELLLERSSLRPNQIDAVVMVGGSTAIPKVQAIAKEVFQTNILDVSIDPDEVVAQGAAILAGVIEGRLRNVHLMDVTSHSLGVETSVGGTQILVPKNTPIPTSITQVFTTPCDNQRSVPITVLEGEEERALSNHPLAQFRLTGIRRAPRGVPRIEVRFAVDADGLLEVTATDQATGKTQNIVITAGYGAGDQEAAERRSKKLIAKQPTETPQQMNMATLTGGATQGRPADDGPRRADIVEHAERVHQQMRDWLKHHASLLPLRSVDQIEVALGKLQRKIEREEAEGIRVALRKLSEISEPYRKAG